MPFKYPAPGDAAAPQILRPAHPGPPRPNAKKIPQLWSVDAAGRLNAHLHYYQSLAWNSPRRFVFMVAGTQGGKTSLGPLWLCREMKTCGPGDYIAVTASFPLLKKKMLPEFLKLFDHTLGWGLWYASDKMYVISKKKSREIWPGLDDYEETRVLFGSANNANSLESATAKAAWVDEIGQDEFTLEAWEAVVRRLSLAQGRAFGGTTLYNRGWFKQQIFDRYKMGDPEICIVQFPSIANPAFPRAEYEKRKATMEPWKFKMFYEGEYDIPPGLIYWNFKDVDVSEGGHVLQDFAIPPEWTRYVGVDPGGTNHAKVYLTHDPLKNRYIVYRETKTGRKTTPEHATEIREHIDAEHTTLALVAGGSAGEDQVRLDYAAAGISVQEPEVTDVWAGIDRVIQLLGLNHIPPRLFIFASCRGLLDQMGTYSRELDDAGEPTNEIRDKKKFHFLDALRYIAQWLAGGTDTLTAGGDRASAPLSGGDRRSADRPTYDNYLGHGGDI